MAFSWLINGGDPNYLLSGVALQVDVSVQHDVEVLTFR